MLSADSGCFVSTKEDTINVEDVMNDDMDGPRNYLVRMEKELAKEWMLAQKVYNKMAKTQLVPALHKCTVHFPCFSGITEIERAPTIYIDDYDEEESEEVPTTTESATCQPCPALLLEEDEAVDVCEAPLVEEQEEQPPVPVKMRLNPVTCQDEVDEDPVAEPDEPYSYKVGKTLEVKKTPSTECRCKEMILKRVEETTCKCEECQEALRLANLKQTFIITDTQEIEGEKPVRIVGGVKSEKLCTCLEKYQARWEKYEKRVEVKKAQQDLKSLEAKFIITGTAVGPDGKLVYILEGVQTEKKCECYKIPKYEEEEKKQLALMPKIPEGCIKYVISGVQARPDGNVYILSGVTQNDDCQCLEYLEKFCENHSFCMYLYQEYLKKIAFDTQEYFKEMPSMYTSFTPEAKSDVVEEEEDEVCPCVCVCDKSPIKCEFYTGPFEEEQAQQQEEEDVCSGYGNSKFEHVSSVGSECRCDDAWDYSSYVCEEEEGVKLERYIILEKFPRKPKDQLELLKGALDKLAEDGFPLAKLPDAYRLPHFGLWLQMRSKKYWTKEERISLYHGSKKPWKYVESNKTHVHIPIETFLRNEKHKQNWSYCKLIKNTGDAMRQKLYRSLKARSIKYARELYPTMYAYEFPTKAFRDVFFAYLPAKEESATPMYLWQQFELIDYARLRNWSKMR